MTIAVGADHAGFEVKQKLVALLKEMGYEVTDVGTNSKESADYPEFAHHVGRLVSSGEVEKGVVVCGTGIGVSISANKIPGVRAALCTTPEHAKLSRKHNDANVLALGARMTPFDTITDILKVWLNTPFDGGRHRRRVEKIEHITF